MKWGQAGTKWNPLRQTGPPEHKLDCAICITYIDDAGGMVLHRHLAQDSETLKKKVQQLLKEFHTWPLPHSKVSQQISNDVHELP